MFWFGLLAGVSATLASIYYFRRKVIEYLKSLDPPQA